MGHIAVNCLWFKCQWPRGMAGSIENPFQGALSDTLQSFHNFYRCRQHLTLAVFNSTNNTVLHSVLVSIVTVVVVVVVIYSL